MSKKIENWKIVEGFNGIYEVSDCGRVRTIEHYSKSGKGDKEHFYPSKIKAQQKTKTGYMVVGLMNGKKTTPVRVHQLVAQAFVPNDDPVNKKQINHKDENKENNCAWNLEWCTPKFNCNYGDRNVKIGSNKSKPVEAFDKEGNLVYKFKSAKEAEKLGFSNPKISQCCNGVYGHKTHKGLIWKFC